MKQTHKDAIKEMYKLHSEVHFFILRDLIKDVTNDTLDELKQLNLVNHHAVETNKFRLTKEGFNIARSFLEEVIEVKEENGDEAERQALIAEAKSLGAKIHPATKLENVKKKLEEFKKLKEAKDKTKNEIKNAN